MAKDLLWRFGEQYEGTSLEPADCAPDPMTVFRAWFAEAVEAQVPSVNAMTPFPN